MSDNSLKLSKFEKGKAPTLLKVEEANRVRDFIGSVLDTTVDIKLNFQDRDSNQLTPSKGEYNISQNNAKLDIEINLPISAGGIPPGFEEKTGIYHVVNGALYTGTFLIKDQTVVE